MVWGRAGAMEEYRVKAPRVEATTRAAAAQASLVTVTRHRETQGSTVVLAAMKLHARLPRVQPVDRTVPTTVQAALVAVAAAATTVAVVAADTVVEAPVRATDTVAVVAVHSTTTRKGG